MQKILNGPELDSAVWLKIKEELMKELETLRDTIESPKMSHDDTQVARGEIKRIKAILALEKPRPKIKSASRA